MKYLHLSGYFGGKYSHLDYLLPLIPKHKHYLDLFGGMMPLLLNKYPTETEVYNDINGRLVNLWQQIQSDYLYLYYQTKYTIWSRKIFLENMIQSDNPKEDAYRFLYTLFFSYSNNNKNLQGLRQGRDVYAISERINEVHKRIRMVKFEQQDFRKLMIRTDTKDWFWYIDPPYYQGGKAYDNMVGNISKWKKKDMTDLITILDHSKAKWMLSIDRDIRNLFTRNDLQFYTYQILNHAQKKVDHQKREIRTEYVIMNYKYAKNKKLEEFIQKRDKL